MFKVRFLPFLLLSIVATSFATGCASKPKRSDAVIDNTPVYGPVPSEAPEKSPDSTTVETTSELIGPPEPTTEESQAQLPEQEVEVPVESSENLRPMQHVSEDVVLVVGPGFADSLALLGVLEVFEKHGVKIRGFYSGEFAALLTAVYASSNLNILKWQMHKISLGDVFDYPVLGFGKKLAKGRAIREFISGAVRADILTKLHIPVTLASTQNQHTEELFQSGNLVDAVMASVSVAQVFKPYPIGPHVYSFTHRAYGELVKAAHASNRGVVVCIQFNPASISLEKKEDTNREFFDQIEYLKAAARGAFGRCDNRLNVDLKESDPLGFSKKADLIYQGRLAAEKFIQRLRQK